MPPHPRVEFAASVSSVSMDTSEAPPPRQPAVTEARPPGIQAGVEERIRLRASAMATELGFSQADHDALLTVLLEEQARRAVVLRELRDESAAARARIRAGLDAILAWKTNVLRDRFGPARASALLRR